MVVPPSSGDSSRYSDGSFSESDDIYMTINTNHGPEFYGVDPPRAQFTKDLSQNERRISVDPISLQGSTTIRQASFRLVSSPMMGSDPSHLIPSPPSKLKFVSSSLPSSTSSSPQSTSLVKKIWKSQNSHKKSTSRSNLPRVQSAMDDTHTQIVETNHQRSRSLGEGRSSSSHADDFDLWPEKSNTTTTTTTTNNNNPIGGRVHSKPPLGPSGNDRHGHMKKSKSIESNYPDDGFNCGKLCLFLPRGKGKPVRSISEVSKISGVPTQVSIQSDVPVISRTVSLERFECGSWSSSLHEGSEGESANLFFDLPMEMLRCSVSDMQSPVTAAFLFENENDNNKDQDINDNENDMERGLSREDLDAFLEAQR